MRLAAEARQLSGMITLGSLERQGALLTIPRVMDNVMAQNPKTELCNCR